MEVLSGIANAFTQGGIWMWLILILQLASLGIIVERFFYLYSKRRPEESTFANQFEEMIRNGNIKTVVEKSMGELHTHPLSYAVLAGAKAASHLGGKEEVQGKMDEVLLDQISHLEKRTNFLPMLANVGTLTGLLGTIMGMIKSFAAVSYANPAEKATLLSSGISEAMNTTAYGLIMAIPTLICFAILANRANVLADDISQGALKVYNWLSYNFENINQREQRGQI